MGQPRNKKLITKVFTVGLIIAFLSFLFHPDAGSFSIMVNGEPVGDDPLVRIAVIPAFLLVILITGVLMTLVFLGVGAFLLIAAIFIAFAVLAVAEPFFWPILLIIFLIIILMSFSHNNKD